MYAERAALHRTQSNHADAARAALRAHLADLADLLASDPVADRSVLRAKIQEVQRGVLHSGADSSLLSLVLRNMLADLARPRAKFDAAYFAQQLARLAAQAG